VPCDLTIAVAPGMESIVMDEELIGQPGEVVEEIEKCLTRHPRTLWRVERCEY
jgi:hypothetical protein